MDGGLDHLRPYRALMNDETGEVCALQDTFSGFACRRLPEGLEAGSIYFVANYIEGSDGKVQFKIYTRIVKIIGPEQLGAIFANFADFLGRAGLANPASVRFARGCWYQVIED